MKKKPKDRRVFLPTLALLASLFSACSEQTPSSATMAPPTQPQEQTLLPSGSMMQDFIQFQFAIYYLPEPAEDPQALLQKLLADPPSKLKLVTKLPDQPSQPVVRVRSCQEVAQEYAPPDREYLQYFGRGLSTEQAIGLQESRHVIILDFAYEKAHVWEGQKAALQLSLDLASQSEGLLWDEATREIFSPEKWRQERVESWKEQFPDVSEHTTIHGYNQGEFTRAITLGMSKFGLPDVIVEEFSWSLNQNMGNLINLFSQALAESGIIERPGEYDLDLHKIQNLQVKNLQMASLKDNAKSVALLTLKEGIRDDGDPDNRLIEIEFDRYEGPDVHSRQQELLCHLFGCKDSISYIKHTEELLAVHRRAVEKLPELYQLFQKGLAPGEFIHVKAPFATPAGGEEWMWVEVTVWEGNTIKDLLKNEPFDIPSLHAGQIVWVKQDEIFDYIHFFPDGRQEGNETGAIILQLDQNKPNS